MEGITIRKSTAYLIVGLALAVLFGAYIAFSSPGSPSQGTTVVSGSPSGGAAQDIYIKALSNGAYDKNEVTVKKGIPVRLHFTADPSAGCGRQFVIYGMNVKAISQSGEEDVVEFTPQQAGTFQYSCGMRMWGPGKLIVV
ncbi:MAG TPA: cupredoxin domain-containing protein [Candidatus Bilamarchaeum sp.]|nr:cupredoxin domain-containing protein [Candidatus Bilamarchaeum sp.]